MLQGRSLSLCHRTAQSISESLVEHAHLRCLPFSFVMNNNNIRTVANDSGSGRGLIILSHYLTFDYTTHLFACMLDESC